MKAAPILAQKFRNLNAVNRILVDDLDRAVVQLKTAYLLFEEDVERFDKDHFNYALKRTVRCFLGWVDATAFVFRDTVLECAPHLKTRLSTKEQKRLRRPRGGPRESLQLGYDYFARVCGSSLRLDKASQGWRAFEELVEIRNGLTHPDSIDDLHATQGLHLLKPVLVWFPALMVELVQDCREHLGLPGYGEREFHQPDLTIEPPSKRIEEVFDAEFYDLLGKSASRSIQYLRICLGILGQETLRAMADAQGAADFTAPEKQYALRNLVRVFFSEIEGISHFLCHELERGAARNEFTITDNDRAGMTQGSVEDRFAETLTVWSREAGERRAPDKRAPGFTAIAEARGVRNRLTHPKKPEELHMSLKRVQALLSAVGWFSNEAYPCLTIDSDNWNPVFPDDKEG